MPEDFPAKARAMSITEAARHWKSSGPKIRVWAESMGKDFHDAMIANGRYASTVGGRMSGRANGKLNLVQKVGESQMPMTIEQKAMRFLQREKRWVCYSSRVHTGVGNVYFHVGNRKLNSDELIELAKKFGFQE
jgi:hypothetical protein